MRRAQASGSARSTSRLSPKTMRFTGGTRRRVRHSCPQVYPRTPSAARRGVPVRAAVAATSRREARSPRLRQRGRGHVDVQDAVLDRLRVERDRAAQRADDSLAGVFGEQVFVEAFAALTADHVLQHHGSSFLHYKPSAKYSKERTCLLYTSP